MAPEAISNFIPSASFESVTLNSIHLSGLLAVQHIPSLTVLVEIHVESFLFDKSTLNVGVEGSHACASARRANSARNKTIRNHIVSILFPVLTFVFNF